MQLNSFNRIFYIFLVIILLFVTFNISGLYFLADDFIHIPLSAALKMVQQNAWRPIGNLSLWFNFILFKFLRTYRKRF